jgi:hypothetical protein
MNCKLIFTGRDLELIESLKYNPCLEPGYCHIKDCLAWEDERVDGLTPDGYESLCDLWIARSFIHRNLDFSAYDLSPEYFRDIWERALKQGFKWPGFNRLILSETDKAFYERMRAHAADFLS